jgi:hypothetical protein
MADLLRAHTVTRPYRDPGTTGFLIGAIGARAIGRRLRPAPPHFSGENQTMKQLVGLR